MNSGIYGEGFPYSNFHDLNMDWIIKIAKDFLDQYTHIQDVIEQGLTDLQDKYENLEGLLNAWYEEHSEDIANQLADALEDLNEWYNLHQNYLDATLEENVNTFTTLAQSIGEGVINSIPDDYTALSNGVDVLRDQLVFSNSVNRFAGEITKTSGTHNGVIYTWSGNTCTITGSPSNASVNTLIADKTALPDDVIPGNTYFLDMSTNNADARLRIIFYTSTNTTISTNYYDKSQPITIPSNAAKWLVQLHTNAALVPPATVTINGLNTSFTNKELQDKTIKPEGILSNNTDLNSVTTQGIWVLQSNSTYSHSPITSDVGGILTVFKGTDTIIGQMVQQVGGNPNDGIYFRHGTGVSPTFSNWILLNNNFISRGTISANTDFNNLTSEGVYFFNSGVTYINSPFTSENGGHLIVFPKAINGSILQLCTTYSVAGRNRSKVRMSLNNTFPGPWADMGGNSYNNTYVTEHYDNDYYITCNPTITTDTNNYLASTGDTTDRTGDIQTLLNTTKICNLGPGDFYVTGVTIPTYGTLRGCGNATRIILAGSVSTGYAVKLQNYGCVKDVRIVGATSNLTPDSVGTRHGILFEGTADSEEEQVTYFHSSILNCNISDFTGGGITCYNTGLAPGSNLEISDCVILRCGAGLNISYFSEFHRVTNVCSQNCLFGLIDNGGNNNFANCDFSSNGTGILIDNSTNQSRNNGHGSFVGCTVNHSGNNSGNAIQILGAENGEIFDAMQIFYGKIIINGSNGIRFIGTNLGSDVPIEITNSTVVTFDHCNIKNSSSSPLTQSNNTALKFTECYLNNGTAYDPMA